MNKFFTLIFLIFTGQTILAQDTLLLISGRKIIVSSVDVQAEDLAYKKMEPGSKVKKMDPERVFSILYKDGTEKIIYQSDSLDSLDFKVEEMRDFIKGERDAMRLYKNTYVKAIGLGVGAGSAMLGFYGVIGPPIFATVVGAFSPNVEKKLTFSVSGDAAEAVGITTGEFMNEIVGRNSAAVIKKDQKLKIAGCCIRFKSDATIDQAVAIINDNFKSARVSASNVDSKLKLFRSEESKVVLMGEPYREGFSKKIRDYKIRNSMIFGFIGFALGTVVYSIAFNN